MDEILLGNGVPGLLIGTIATSVTILAAVLWFDESLRDNPLALSFGVLLFVASVIGTGAAMASIGAAQQHALLGAFLFVVPSIVFSGFATPIVSLPTVVRTLTWLNPMPRMLIVARCLP